MKHTIITVLLMAVFATAAVAQFNVGLKAGANIFKIDGRSFNEEFRWGYHAGGFMTIGLGSRIAIQPEVLFNQINTRTDNDFRAIYQQAFNNVSDVKLNYLSIPVLLNYKANSLLSLQAGPMFGVLLDQNKNLLQNGEEAFRNGDFSMLGGVQLHILKLRLAGRYVVGLNNINDIDNQDKWKNQGFQVSLGFAL